MQDIPPEQMCWRYSRKAGWFKIIQISIYTFDICRIETVCIKTLVLPPTFPVFRLNLAHNCAGLQEFGEFFGGWVCTHLPTFACY